MYPRFKFCINGFLSGKSYHPALSPGINEIISEIYSVKE
jgi:hypothetical protein